MRSLLILLVLLAGCARPLSDAETAFARSLHGGGLDMSAVRVHRGALIGNITIRRPARPAKACRERIRPAEKGVIETSTAAIVLFDRVFYARRFWQRDFLGSYPARMQLEDAMLLAHELTHVWQWQNRATTGYHPFKAASEHRPGGDPYLFDLASDLSFHDFSYEQQGALVEEFVCCRALDPEGARTRRLHGILDPIFPGIAQKSVVQPQDVLLFWLNAPRSGICS